MADPAHPPDPQPNTASAAPALHFNSSPMVPPPPPHPPTAFHYPPMYMDPVAAAATTAFYRQQQAVPASQQQTTAQQQPPQQQQARQSAPQSHAQQPYSYLQDPAAVTAVALQHMQLQVQFQLQAQQQAQQQQAQQQQARLPSNSQPLRQPQSSAPLAAPLASQAVSMPSQPQMGSASVGAHPPAMLSTHPHMPGMIPPNSVAMTNRMHPHIPVVPEAQMASAYRIGRYTPAERRIRLERYREKRAQRNYNRRVKYDCRKMIADKRRRVQGRFVKREEEEALAAQQSKASEANGKADNAEEGTEDGTEDETKLHQPESSGSGSSGQPLESVTAHGRGMNGVGGPSTGEQESYCDQSDQVLHQFR